MAEQKRSGQSRDGAERPCYYQTPVTELTEKDKRKKQKRNSWLVFLECEPSRRSLVGRRRRNGVVEKIELRRGGKRKGK
jgi:hypothetical protein